MWAVGAVCWGLDITGLAPPEVVSRGAIAAALAASAAWVGLRLAMRFAGRSWRQRAAAAVLPALLLLALAVRVVGIDSEVEGRYYLDEGTYYHHATAINNGEVLRRSFAYPHLTYYADALALWMAARFPGLATALAARLFQVTDPLAVAWLLLRLVVAVLSALTVVPVFRIAARLATTPAACPLDGAAPAAAGGLSGAPACAGALASALLIFSPLYNEGSHLNTCDVPSAFFATACLACAARLLDEERGRDYALAGVAAGLALASKYPAGLVAVAIVAVWLRWRLVRRDFRLGLLWAGLAALATVLAVMPSLFAYPEMAFHGQRGIFFGARQYGTGGWLGVMPDSNFGFYLDKLAWSFGIPALAAGLAGLATLGRARAARLLWLAPFPALYLALIVSMNMVVKRNLYPALPILSAFLGVGIAAGLQWLLRAGGPASRVPRRLALSAAGAVVLLLLVPPADLTARQDIGLATPSTRERAAAWIRDHLPPGSSILKESYTPDLDTGRFAVSHERFATRMPIADLRDVGNDFLLLSSSAYARFRDPEALFKPHQKELAQRYDEIFRTFPLVQEWLPGDFQAGPVLRLYRVDPQPAACQPSAVRAAADAFVSDPAMRPALARPIRFTATGQWALFKACLPSGRYHLTVAGAVLPNTLVRVTDSEGKKLDTVPLALTGKRASGAGSGVISGGVIAGDATGTVQLPRRGKYLFYAFLPAGSRLRELKIGA
jgi:4-amino-4-deoxy-L-arabinose transferase-like glycosyltransferase